eukprot:6641959-Pyramimonas_sp.AAC.1
MLLVLWVTCVAGRAGVALCCFIASMSISSCSSLALVVESAVSADFADDGRDEVSNADKGLVMSSIDA